MAKVMRQCEAEREMEKGWVEPAAVPDVIDRSSYVASLLSTGFRSV
jgi:hypothetical protein